MAIALAGGKKTPRLQNAATCSTLSAEQGHHKPWWEPVTRALALSPSTIAHDGLLGDSSPKWLPLQHMLAPIGCCPRRARLPARGVAVGCQARADSALVLVARLFSSGHESSPKTTQSGRDCE